MNQSQSCAAGTPADGARTFIHKDRLTLLICQTCRARGFGAMTQAIAHWLLGLSEYCRDDRAYVVRAVAQKTLENIIGFSAGSFRRAVLDLENAGIVQRSGSPGEKVSFTITAGGEGARAGARPLQKDGARAREQGGARQRAPQRAPVSEGALTGARPFKEVNSNSENQQARHQSLEPDLLKQGAPPFTPASPVSPEPAQEESSAKGSAMPATVRKALEFYGVEEPNLTALCAIQHLTVEEIMREAIQIRQATTRAYKPVRNVTAALVRTLAKKHGLELRRGGHIGTSVVRMNDEIMGLRERYRDAQRQQKGGV